MHKINVLRKSLKLKSLIGNKINYFSSHEKVVFNYEDCLNLKSLMTEEEQMVIKIF